MGAESVGNDEGKVLDVTRYSEYWAYLRHTEEMQNKIILWYAAVVGGCFTFAVKTPIMENIDSFPWPLALFLFLYSIFICFKLLRQKVNYRKWAGRMHELGDTSEERNNPFYKQSFFYIFIPIVIIGSGCTGFAVYILIKQIAAYVLCRQIIIYYFILIPFGSTIYLDYFLYRYHIDLIKPLEDEKTLRHILRSWVKKKSISISDQEQIAKLLAIDFPI